MLMTIDFIKINHVWFITPIDYICIIYLFFRRSDVILVTIFLIRLYHENFLSLHHTGKIKSYLVTKINLITKRASESNNNAVD